MSLATRRREIKQLVSEVIKKEKTLTSENFKATYERMELKTLFEETIIACATGWRLTELFILRQGVTWGGEGCESVFVDGKPVAAE